MNRATASRLARLEQKLTPPKRTFILWDSTNYDPAFDLQHEVEHLRDEGGMTDHDELIVLGWLAPQA
jgi:hypothetical protein